MREHSFESVFEVINDTQLKPMESCKDHLTLQKCLTLIDNAWTQVTYRTLNFRILPDFVAERYFEGIESDDRALIDAVVPMETSMGSEVESEDVHEVLKCHEIKLNT